MYAIESEIEHGDGIGSEDGLMLYISDAKSDTFYGTIYHLILPSDEGTTILKLDISALNALTKMLNYKIQAA